jgi:hypothetical protein
MKRCKGSLKRIFLLLMITVQVTAFIVPYQKVAGAAARQMEKLDRD